ncbi:NAD(P)H-hydrate dehydratase [Krasilnikovia sp. MM14-A1004]|uniref:NAD(P)H-hydrate dehydratase n=1 Tax=Krasilnikovia sp. MM14-A1004 TaxID=3373541 RepID=UPI00399C6046
MPNPADEAVVTPRLLRAWPLPDPEGDKKDRGTVLIVGGSRDTPGAVLLAGVAALRSGAGRLQLAVEASTAASLSIAVPEAKVVSLPERHGDAPDALLELAAEADVIALGPGLDDVDETAALMTKVLDAAAETTAVVLDAYALGALSTDDGLLAGRTQPVVLTPNITEAARLAQQADVGDDLAGTARAIAARYRAVVALHGHVAAPDGRCWREESGDVGLATSGSGDVHAGIVAGLLARGADAAQAACWATFAHAVSGQRLAPRYGRTGFLARELVDEVAYTLAMV